LSPDQRRGAAGEQVEGRQAVRELLRARKRTVSYVLVGEGTDESEVITEILRLARESGVAVRRLARAELDARARTDAPQGVIAIAAPLAGADLGQLVRRGPAGTPPLLVVLDGVTDPHNVGAVMRSALSAGATGLVLGRHRASGLGPTAVKAAAGAVEHLPVATVAGIASALSDLSKAGVWTVALDQAATTPLWDLTLASEPVALVLGDEGRGLSRLVRERCDLAVRIPLLGPLDSLNVSAAAALACFEVARRRHPN
jgi:23S rRNA (guanosine2251-2'-O)-methyltransferase